MRFARIFNIIFCVFFAALLLLPLFFFNFKGVVSSENRMLTAFPSRPKNFAEVPRFTNGIETWLNDRIGFRNNLVALCRYIEVYGLGVSPSKIVALGEKGTAFLLRAEQSTIKYEEVREALGETGDGKSLYDSQLAVLQRNAEAIEKSPYNTVVLAVPTAPLFRFDDLPKYVRMTVSRKTPMDHPVSMAMKTFEKVNPEGCRHFLFPFVESVKLAESWTLYPQKNFHWSWSPFTAMVSELVAEKLGQPVLRRFVPKDFAACATESDLSHLVGVKFTNENDICPSLEFYEGMELSSALIGEAFPSPEGTSSVSGTYYKNTAVPSGKVLVIGDSFNFNIGLPLARNFREVVVIDYFGVARETQGKPFPVLHHIKKAYRPEQIVIIRHNIFPDIAKMQGIETFFE